MTRLVNAGKVDKVIWSLLVIPRMMCWKLVHGCLPATQRLVQMRIGTEDNCPLCNQGADSSDYVFTVSASCRSTMDRSILYDEDVAIREGLLAARNKPVRGALPIKSDWFAILSRMKYFKPFISIFIIINQIARSAKREEMKLYNSLWFLTLFILAICFCQTKDRGLFDLVWLGWWMNGSPPEGRKLLIPYPSSSRTVVYCLTKMSLQ